MKPRPNKIIKIAKLILRVGIPLGVSACLLFHHGEVIGNIIGFEFFTYVYLFVVGIFLILGILIELGIAKIENSFWYKVFRCIEFLIPILSISLTIYIFVSKPLYCMISILTIIVVELGLRLLPKIDINLNNFIL